MKKKSKLWNEIKRNRQLYILFLPILIYFLVFHYGSMYGSVIAFMDYKPAKGFLNSEWVGVKHFIRFFQDPYFGRLMKNTIAISLGSLLVCMPVTIIFALLLNEVRNSKFKRIVQTVSYLPHFVSLVVICGMIKVFVSSDGIITTMLSALGIVEKQNLLMVAEYYQPIHIISRVWQVMGWDSIIYLSALASIDQEQYEAADLDGAGRFAKMRYITLPSIVPTISVMLIMKIGHVMSVGYEKVILLYNTTTYETADVFSSYIYRMGLASSYPQFSYTTAVGLVQSVINIALVTISNYISKKLKGSSLW
ncbi:MAG: sugar ABC transporter permease [Lachnospiraceae bacterium]|nr:sugar ABC transporter permease [Lachnospiraceae bacterium]